MFNDAYLAIIRFMEMGGDVLWFIAAITFLMWSLIFERIWFFRTEYKMMVLEASSKWEGRGERKEKRVQPVWTAAPRARVHARTLVRVPPVSV